MKIRKIYLSTIISSLIMCSCDRSKSENEQNSKQNSGQVSKNVVGDNSIDETLDEDESNTGNNDQKNHSGSDNTSNDGNNGSNNGPNKKNKQKSEVDTNAENIEGRYYKGIINVGNTCYMNSILQQIWAIPELVNVISIIDTDTTVFDNDYLKNDIIGLQAFFKLMDNDKKISVDEMKKVATNLGWNRTQKDAVELMEYILEALGNAKSDICSIEIDNQNLYCNECGKTETEYSPSKGVLKYYITADNLHDCLTNCFKEESLDEFKCGLCLKNGKEQKGKTRKNKIVKSPDILLIQLLRGNKIGKKVNEKVKFPEVLDLKKDWFDGNLKLTSDESYDLSGIVMHDGGADGGHYFSYCKLADNNWYQFNDSSFMKVNNPKAMFNNAYGDGKSALSAYLLVYKKKK